MPNKHVSIFNLSYEIHELMKPKKTLYQQEGGLNFAGYDPNLLLGGGYGAGDFGAPSPPAAPPFPLPEDYRMANFDPPALEPAVSFYPYLPEMLAPLLGPAQQMQQTAQTLGQMGLPRDLAVLSPVTANQ